MDGIERQNQKTQSSLCRNCHSNEELQVQTGRYGDGDFLALDGGPFAVAVLARMRNVHPRSHTPPASRSHDERAGANRFHSGAVAVRAFDGPPARLAPRSGAFRARVHHVQRHVLVDALGRLGERQIHRHLPIKSIQNSIFR